MESPAPPPLGICVLREPPRNAARTATCGVYLEEIVAHAGLCHRQVAAEDLGTALPRLRMLVTVGEALPAETREALCRWVEAGGAWIGIGGTAGAAELFGVEVEPARYTSWGGGTGTLGEGYLDPLPEAHPVTAGIPLPLHFFNGTPVRPAGGQALARVLDAHGRATERAAVVERRVGRGRCLLIAPDLTGAVVRIQQGIAVTRDGVSAPDGTAPVQDGVLKTGDGAVLDWLLDRRPVPDVPGLCAFLYPVADAWRELLLRAVFYVAEAVGVRLPVLWYYPRDLPALGHLSHDSDGNDPGKAARLLAALAGEGVASTWCVLPPGYDAATIAAIRAGGHELAMHFDAMSPGAPWSEAAFDVQFRQLAEIFGAAPTTNKNHYLRWEGDTELFDWCARRGIGVEQSKGASKTGEAGFNFGTCHPHHPLSPDGRRIEVLEIPTPTQDLCVFAPEALLPPLLDAAVRHHGILHLLFHPAHVERPEVEAALRTAVGAGRGRGLEWWTAAAIGRWERARRALAWRAWEQSAEQVRIEVDAGVPLPEATLLWLAPEPLRLRAPGGERATRPVQRWGFAFQAAVLDLDGRCRVEVRGG